MQTPTNSSPAILLRGVRVHNLKNVDLDIPLGKLVVICGVSGAGKSSLAVETLFAEGRRRFLAGFSTTARQYLERLERPDADRIDRIPPTIAIHRTSTRRSRRQTVATATELTEFLQILYTRLSAAHCPQCGVLLRRDTAETVQRWLAARGPGTRFQIGFAISIPLGETAGEVQTRWSEQGFARFLVEDTSDGATPREMLVVVDRLVVGKAEPGRVRDSLETAFRLGRESCAVIVHDAAEPAGRPFHTPDMAARRIDFRQVLRCDVCQIDLPLPEPRLFSFFSPLGACRQCGGLGEIRSGGRKAQGETCPDCRGMRLSRETRTFVLAGKSLGDVYSLSPPAVSSWLAMIPEGDDPVALAALLAPIRRRLDLLAELGLEYLTLNRGLSTLSQGEMQRVALTSVCATQLVQTLFVMDEPAHGLHASEKPRLLAAIRRLQRAGNTVVMIEHDELFLRAADELIELGPGAGNEGGRVIVQGTLDELMAHPESPTGAVFVAGKSHVNSKPRVNSSWLELKGATRHSLHDLTVRFPLGVLCAVTGVSGSGKSSLVTEMLYPALCRALGQPCPLEGAGQWLELVGAAALDEVQLVDPAPPARSPRSNPTTYLGAFAALRGLFAETEEARLRNFTPATFSLHTTESGRCPHCEGRGVVSVEMQFLPDIAIACPECHGARYRQDVLEARYRGLNMAEILALTAREAIPLFRGEPQLQKRLTSLKSVGLDYLTLGQPLQTLSGGESQRLKLAAALARQSGKRTLFLLEEPTTGLHPRDIGQLLDCLHALLSGGNSIIVIEHNLQLIRNADYLIDLGPGAGEHGGQVVAAGTPAEITKVAGSATGQALRELLSRAAVSS